MRPFTKNRSFWAVIGGLGLILALYLFADQPPALAAAAETRLERCVQGAVLQCRTRPRPGGCPARLCSFLDGAKLESLWAALATDWGQTEPEKPTQIVRLMVPPWCTAQSLEGRTDVAVVPAGTTASGDDTPGLESDAALNLCGEPELHSLCQRFSQRLAQCLSRGK